MEYKRLNIRIPVELYQTIKDYCDSVGAPIGSGMCMLCDAQINALKAQKLLSEAKSLKDQLTKVMKEIDELKAQESLS